MINMMDILPNMLFLIAVIVIISFVISLPLAFVCWFYFKKKAEHIKLRIAISKEIVDLTARMREKVGSFSDEQKKCLNYFIDVSESKFFIIPFYVGALAGVLVNFKNRSNQKQSMEQAEKNLEELSGFSRDDEVFSDFIGLLTLCILMASTYNFFLGSLCRRHLFARLSENPKLVKTTAKEEAVVYKPIFSNFVENFSLAA